jgi:glucose/arabinose dehydrogenase
MLAGKHTRALLAAAAISVSVLGSPPPARALPPQFEDTLVASISGPMEVAWTPDGRMLVPSKGGLLWVHQNGQETVAIDLSSVMCTNGERALGGVAVHPGFGVGTNRFIYLYYTYNKFGTCNESEIDGPVNRLSRFVLRDDDVVDPASETVLMDTPPLFRDHHNGGDLWFAHDGHLYATVGDGGSSRFEWPQDLGRLLGKVIRITDTGGIPPDNPFTGLGTARCNLNGVPPAGSSPGTKCQEVYAYGLRNPFRFAFDPNDPGVKFHINDVGQHSWEEVNLGARGANYGWPIREGPCVADSTTDCGPPPPGMTNPVWYYQHGINGAAVTGGVFPPNDVWPAEYDGTYLYADYVFGTIYKLTPDGAGSFTQSVFAEIPDVVSLRFGPDGSGQSLYYVSRFSSEIHRVRFTGSANRAPVAVATGNPTSGPVPLQVDFDGTGSSDPDDDVLEYEWDFESDGTVDATEATITHTYSTAGDYTARLTVRDPSGAQGSDTVAVSVGNTPPTPVIETPLDGSRFAVGEQFTLHGSATDAEDGTLADADMSWEVIRHHATHTHPFLDPTAGNDIQIAGPEPEDLDAASDSYLKIKLTATDSSGLSATVERDLMPKFVDVVFETQPAGLELNVSGNTITGPATVRSWEAFDLNVNAPAQTDSLGRLWSFASWSDGGAASHTIATPASPATYTAAFQPSTSQTLTFTPAADAYVRQDAASSNFGSDPTLQVDGSPVKDTLLRFDVSGVGAADVTSARLRLHNVDAASAGGDVHTLVDPLASWSEGSVNWGSAPAGDPSILGSFGAVSPGNWYEVDVTGAVNGDGPVNLRITSTASNGADYASKEGAAGLAPQLVVSTASSGPPPPTTAPYPRPGGGTPLRVPLVPHYLECTPASAQGSHVLPLDARSCSPPQPSSSLLSTSTTGRQTGSARFEVRAGLPSTPADEADVVVSASATDVTAQGGGDYAGSAILRAVLRMTDGANDPGGSITATVADAELSIPVSCAATSDPDTGGACSLTTTTDTILPDDFAKEGKRAVISVLSLALLDAGADGSIAPAAGACPPTCGSGDERIYLDQGLFAP